MKDSFKVANGFRKAGSFWAIHNKAAIVIASHCNILNFIGARLQETLLPLAQSAWQHRCNSFHCDSVQSAHNWVEHNTTSDRYAIVL